MADTENETHPLERARPDVADAFVRATTRCCNLFLDDEGHSKGRSPLIHGPCDACIMEVVTAMTEDDRVVPD